MRDLKSLFKCTVCLFAGVFIVVVALNISFLSVIFARASNVVICSPEVPTTSFQRPIDDAQTNSKAKTSTKTLSFVQALASRVSDDKIIILAYVDLPFVDMAANFFETSLKAHGITQFMFATSGADCCDRLVEFGIPPEGCFVYRKDAASGKASSFGSKDFIRKMNIRTDMILDALLAGFSVIHTDIDIVFAKNPLPTIKSVCTSCDVAALWDAIVYNAGFVYVRPTTLSIVLYKHMQNMSRAGTKLDDQQQLNFEIKNLKKQKPKPIHVVKLNTSQFLCGKGFFEDAGRAFAGDKPCLECIVIHNNWIVSEAAKVYRFREYHMWMIDNDGYYSSTTTKYLTFDLPVKPSGNDTRQVRLLERAALVSALAIGQILDRVVIMPRFHCRGGKKLKYCPANDNVMIVNLDAAFGDLYREHTFLQHVKVPDSVKKSYSPVYRINAPRAFSQFKVNSSAAEGTYDNPKVFQPQQLQEGASSDEIKQWFGKNTESVLRFHSLYGAFHKFTSDSDQQQFSAKIDEGVIAGNYRQYTDKKHQDQVIF